MKQVTIAGMGPGSAGCMTQEVCRAVKQADVLIGSERLIAPYTDQRTVKAVTAAEILRVVENEDGEHFTVLMSGDTGFYSGTKKLVEQLNGKYAYRILPGISSVIYFAAKIGVAWEQAAGYVKMYADIVFLVLAAGAVCFPAVHLYRKKHHSFYFSLTNVTNNFHKRQR